MSRYIRTGLPESASRYIAVIGTAYPYPVKPDGTPDNEELRRWGRANGFTVSNFGPVSLKVRSAWMSTHRDRVMKAPLVRLIKADR